MAKNMENKTTENKTTELSTIHENALNVCNVDKVQSLTNAALREETINLVNCIGDDASAQYMAASAVDALRKQQGMILYRIDKMKLYEKDGFKNFTAYCESIGLSEDVKSRVTQMKTAGEVLSDKTAPDSLKNLPYTVIGQLGAVIHDAKAYAALKEDAAKEGFTMTQAEAKARAKLVRDTKNPPVIPTYGALNNGKYIKKDGDPLFMTEEEWTKFFGGEVIKLPADKNGDKRYLSIIDGTKISLYALRKREVESKPKAPEAPAVPSIEQMAAFLGVTVEQLTALKNDHA